MCKLYIYDLKKLKAEYLFSISFALDISYLKRIQVEE